MVAPLHNGEAQGAPRPARRAALVFFGRTGSVWTKQHYNIMGGLEAPSMEAAYVAWGSVQDNVLDHNKGLGWEVDIFFHTWDMGLNASLVGLYKPVASAIGPGAVNGRLRANGPHASVELGLQLVANSGRSYDRVLLTRFDAMYRAPFSLDALQDDSALYVAHWCQAEGEFVHPSTIKGAEAAHICRTLTNVRIDAVALPDFYFAGSLHTLLAYADGLEEDTAPEIWKEVREDARYRMSEGANNHFVWFGHAQRKQVSIRRYFVHYADINIVRFAQGCLADPESVAGMPANLSTWFVRDSPALDVSTSMFSECHLNGRIACARYQGEWDFCQIFKFG